MLACSVIGCLEVAVDDADRLEARGVLISDVAEVARELIDEAVNALDSASLAQALAGRPKATDD